MKDLQLMNKVVIVFLVLLTFGCDKEPCLDIPALDKISAETKEWYVNDSIGNRTLTDDNGISQTLKISNAYAGGHDDSVEDDCGNHYGSFYFFIQYQTSVSPLNIEVDIHGDALPEDGFYLKLSIMNTATYDQKSTTYDFLTKTSRENNATIEFLDQLQISNREYSGVLKITFNQTSSENDIKTVFYSKGYGVIKFIEANGIEFSVN